MNLTFTYRDLESSAALEASVEKRLAKIRKLVNSSIDVHCIMTVEGRRHKVELNLRGAGHDFSAHDSGDDMYKAANNAVARLEKQVSKHFDKLRSH